jgi:small subunit ribosomal protein S8
MATLTDPIADFLTRFKNSVRARQESFEAPYSRLKADIARILKEEGFIWNYEVTKAEDGHPRLVVTNRFEGKVPALTDLRRVSKPGRRRYVGSQDVPKVIKGFGIAILSTPKGVLSGAKARRANVGGEYLAEVW